MNLPFAFELVVSLFVRRRSSNIQIVMCVEGPWRASGTAVEGLDFEIESRQ